MLAERAPFGVRLEHVANRKVGKTKYEKWRVTLPKQMIEELGWKKGDELTPSIESGKLVIRRAKSKTTSD